MVFVTVQDFHSMCQKHFHYLMKKRDPSSPSLGFEDSFIKASRSEVLSLFMRSMLLALLFMSFTWLILLKYGIDATSASKSVESNHHELLPLLLNDLQKEGLFKLGDKALLLDEVTVTSYSQTVFETEVLFVSASDEETQSIVPDETFDFSFAHSRHIDSAEFVDRTLKVSGILTVQLNLQDINSTNPTTVVARQNGSGISWLFPSIWRRARVSNISASNTSTMQSHLLNESAQQSTFHNI